MSSRTGLAGPNLEAAPAPRSPNDARSNFTQICKEVEGATSAQLECAKQEFDELPQAKKAKRTISVSDDCREGGRTVQLDDCGKELAAKDLADITPTVYRHDLAMNLCETTSAKTRATARALLAQGYGGTFGDICGEIEGAGAGELACARKFYDAMGPARKKATPFSILDSACDKK